MAIAKRTKTKKSPSKKAAKAVVLTKAQFATLRKDHTAALSRLGILRIKGDCKVFACTEDFQCGWPKTFKCGVDFNCKEGQFKVTKIATP
jgi:hypothetical protein